MKKGFTLIELLAVIVVLAIIALISIPVIINSIDDARKTAWKDTAHGITKSLENLYAEELLKNETSLDMFFLYENKVFTSYPNGININYKGLKPQDGGIVLHSDGNITMAIYDSNNCAIKKKFDNDIAIIKTDKNTCLANVYYKQASAPFASLITNGDFSNGLTGFDGANALINGAASKKNISQYDSIRFVHANHQLYRGHRIFSKADIKADSNQLMFTITDGMAQSSSLHSGSGNFETHTTIWTIGFNSTTFQTRVQDNRTSNYTNYYLDNVITIDLTAIYGSGNEPTKEEMDHNINKVWINSTNQIPMRFTAGGWINF